MRISTILTIGALIIASLTGCKKEVVGPQGETGQKGETGAQGPTGSSNVTVQNVSVSPGNWSTYNTYNLYFNTSVSIPTTDACMVYVSTNNSVFSPLPSMAFYQNEDQFSFNYSSQHYLQLSYYNPNGVTGVINQTLVFKIISISPIGLTENPGLDLNDYQAVQKAFDLK